MPAYAVNGLPLPQQDSKENFVGTLVVSPTYGLYVAAVKKLKTSIYFSYFSSFFYYNCSYRHYNYLKNIIKLKKTIIHSITL